LFHAHEKLEYLDQESHALWTHLEERLEIFWRAQVFEIRDLSLNIWQPTPPLFPPFL
jgi:hypothetical protein